MYRNHDGIVFSPSDLVVFLESEFASWMDRWHVEDGDGEAGNGGVPGGLVCERDESDDEMKLIAKKGMEHESRFLKRLQNEGREVVNIGLVDKPQMAEATIDAMRRGVEFIYQARLQYANFEGYADFLARIKGESEFGDYHYEAWDTKLARSVKPYFVVQLCSYSEMLQHAQGRQPDTFSIVLGTDEKADLDVRKFVYYFRALQRSFLRFHEEFSADEFPDPGLSRSHGRWSTFAKDCLEEADHLCQVANITRTQIRKLEAAGIRTMTKLASTKKGHVPRLALPVFERLKVQARLQVKSKNKATPQYEAQLPHQDDPRKGLALLPPNSPNDVFFDIEGFPLVDGGLEYLLGAVCFEKGSLTFRDWWAHEQQQERQAFQEFVDWLYDRWKADPSLHVYHYASYEVAAMRRLMGKHATREREIDDLLRNHVFVDLYTVVRQGLIIGTAGYSLKDIECLYMKPRKGAVTTAGGSVVAYHKWMESSESEDWRESPILKEIRDYNQFDCESTQKLTQWLRGVQKSHRIKFVPPPPPKQQEEEKPDHPAAVLANELLQAVLDGGVTDPEEARIQQLLAWLLEYHRREAKPVHWRMFARNEMTEQELIDDFECLGGLQRTKKAPQSVKKSWSYQYAFDPDQDTKLHEGSTCFFAHDLSVKTTIEHLDAEEGIVEIKLGPKHGEPPKRLSLIPREHVGADVIADAVFRYVEKWSEGTILSSAVDDLLHHRPPRLKKHRRGPIIPENADLLEASIDAIQRMNQTVLCIQGPPGSGKTYTAAHAILSLLKDGKCVGVSANSHKAILNVLNAVHEAAKQAEEDVRIVKVGKTEDDPLIEVGEIEHVVSGADVGCVLGDGPVVVGGTAWAFCNEEVQGEFDYLFIDEAGQFSLANTVAVGLAARNIVLIGDQMQLAQPVQGSHPGESSQSALNYLLSGHATIPPDMGIFLDCTRRLHPDICNFISQAVYDGRLQAHPDTKKRCLEINGGQISKEAGILFVPVEHEGNSQGSEEEAAVIEELAKEIQSCQVFDDTKGKMRKLTLDDILFVAPFNMQVRLLKNCLGPQAKVGSVDKFQGQEAHVVIVSMCSSSLEDSPRGADFLLDPNRLNVAVSRAKSLVIVVGHPLLAARRCSSLREMELSNLFCWLIDYANGES